MMIFISNKPKGNLSIIIGFQKFKRKDLVHTFSTIKIV